MKTEHDPTGDLYRIFDDAGLDATKLLDSKKSMSRIINEMRTRLAASLKIYIERRDKQSFKDGVGSTEPRKIEVKDE